MNDYVYAFLVMIAAVLGGSWLSEKTLPLSERIFMALFNILIGVGMLVRLVQR